MAKVGTIPKMLWIVALLIFWGCALLPAATVSTQLSSVAHGIADRFNDYAAAHNGAAPKSWDDLRPYLDFDRMEITLGGALQTKMILLGDVQPTIEGSSQRKVVAMTAFPISEDRRKENGRYIVYQQDNGKFAAQWESEQTIQKALASANVSVPPAAIHQEQLLKPLDPEYGMKLVEDAVKHGIPMDQAVRVVEKHVNEVSNRRAKAATTWAEVAAAASLASAPPLSAQATPQAATNPSLQAPATGAQTSAPSQKSKPPLWPLLVGIAAIITIVACVLKRRTQRPCR